MTNSNQSNLKKHIIVTGGAKGIGLLIVNHILSELEPNCQIYVIQRTKAPEKAHQDKLFSIRHSGTQRVIWISADLSQVDEIKRVQGEISQYTDTIHVLVNNSGATWGQTLEKYSEKGFDKVMNLNAKTPFFMVQTFLPMLKKVSEVDAEQRARIINIGSINGLHPPSLPTFAYSSSKAALHMQTRHIARHVAPRITCNAIACGLFHTNMTRGTIQMVGAEAMTQGVPMERMGNGNDIGQVVGMMMRSDWITGSIVTLDGGMSLQSRF